MFLATPPAAVADEGALVASGPNAVAAADEPTGPCAGWYDLPEGLLTDVAAYLDAHDLLAARATCKAWRLGLGSCISSLQLPVLPQQGVQQPALAAAVRSALAALPRLGSVSITLLPSTPPEAVEEVLCAVDGARHIAIEEAHLLDGVPDSRPYRWTDEAQHQARLLTQPLQHATSLRLRLWRYPMQAAWAQVAALTQLVTLDLDCPHEARLHPPALQLPLLPRLRWLRCWLPAKGAPGVTLPGQLHDAFVAALAGSCPQLETLQLLGSWDTHASSALPCQLTRLAAQPALRSLDITRNCFAMTLDEFGDGDMDPWCGVLPTLTRLTALRLTVKDQGLLDLLQDLQVMTQLQELALRNCSRTRMWLAAGRWPPCCQLSGMTALRRLVLSSLRCPDVRHLSMLTGLQHLELLECAQAHYEGPADLRPVLGALGALTSLIIQPSAAQFEHHARRALDCLPHFYISQPAEAWAGLTALRQLGLGGVPLHADVSTPLEQRHQLLHSLAAHLRARTVPKGLPLLQGARLQELPPSLTELRLSSYVLELPLPPAAQLSGLQCLRLEHCTGISVHLPGASCFCGGAGDAAGHAGFATDTGDAGSDASQAGSAASGCQDCGPGSGRAWEQLPALARLAGCWGGAPPGTAAGGLPMGMDFTAEPLLPALLDCLGACRGRLRELHASLAGVAGYDVPGGRVLGRLPALRALTWVHHGQHVGRDLAIMAAWPSLQRSLRRLQLTVVQPDPSGHSLAAGLGGLAQLGSLRQLSLHLGERVALSREEVLCLGPVCRRLRSLRLRREGSSYAVAGYVLAELQAAAPACAVAQPHACEAIYV